jgi:hypothetical protein
MPSRFIRIHQNFADFGMPTVDKPQWCSLLGMGLFRKLRTKRLKYKAIDLLTITCSHRQDRNRHSPEVSGFGNGTVSHGASRQRLTPSAKP